MKPNKILLFILSPIFILVLVIGLTAFFWFSYQELPSRVSFYKNGTDIPIAGKHIDLFYYPLCVESPCVSFENSILVYSGNTDKDGSIFIPHRHAMNINRSPSGHAGRGMDEFEYWVNTDGFIRPLYTSDFRDSNIVYLNEVPDHKAYKVENGRLVYKLINGAVNIEEDD